MARTTRTLIAGALIVLLVSGTLAGMAAGVMLGGRAQQEISLATIETSVEPRVPGDVSVYVPIVDWQVSILSHKAPVRLNIELRGIDRSRAGESISSRQSARQSLNSIEKDSHEVIVNAITRAAISALIGGMVGGILTGALAGAMLRKRRFLLYGVSAGIICSALVVGGSAWALSGLDAREIEADAVTPNAEELPQVLTFAQQLLVVGDEYEQHYKTALASVENLVSFTRSSRGDSTRSVLVASDIHDNVFILDAFNRFVGDRSVFLVGDFGQVGAKIEERTAPQIASLGGRAIAVSGNHDSYSYMESLREAGATVLPEDPDEPTALFEVDGLKVAGYPDPLERKKGARGKHVLRVYGEEYAEQVDDFIAWWDSLPERPDIVMVHQHGLAHKLMRHLEKTDEDDAPPIAIFTGHDHKAHVHELKNGKIVLVDGGSLGAGGPFAIGSQPAAFAQVHLSDTQVVSVDIVEIEPLSGNANTQRIYIGE